MSIKEKRQTLPENINIQAFAQCRFYVCFAVGERKSQFLRRRRACFADMITRNRNCIEFGQFGTAPFKNIGDNFHRCLRRVNISAACRIFF